MLGCMILGVGTDVCEVGRVADALSRHGSAFVDRICSISEQEGPTWSPSAKAIAVRFAVKEACAKALGRGITERLRWHDIVVISEANFGVSVSLMGGARRRARRLSRRKDISIHAAVSHNADWVYAFVVLEAER